MTSNLARVGHQQLPRRIRYARISCRQWSLDFVRVLLSFPCVSIPLRIIARLLRRKGFRYLLYNADGWRWQCPNEKAGERCKYKHCLPVGYRLQSDIKALAAEEKEKSKSVEDDIEEKRSAVNNATPVTEEVFMQWYKRKREERDRKKREELEERKKTGRLTGREIIQSGAIIADDENAQSKAEQQQEISHMRAQEEEDEQTADINDIYKDGNDTNVASAEDEHNENAAESRLRSDTQSNDS